MLGYNDTIFAVWKMGHCSRITLKEVGLWLSRATYAECYNTNYNEQPTNCFLHNYEF